MLLIKAKCSLYGEGFSPKAAEVLTGLSFKEKNELHEIGTRGRYIGKPIPYGNAILEAQVEHASNLDKILDLIGNHLTIFRDCGAEDIVLHCDVFFDKQCNFEFSEPQLAKISKLNIPLTISCYQK
jgi:hypothetical protein